MLFFHFVTYFFSSLYNLSLGRTLPGTLIEMCSPLCAVCTGLILLAVVAVSVGLVHKASASVPSSSEGIVVVGLGDLARAAIYDYPDTAEMVVDVVVRHHLNAVV